MEKDYSDKINELIKELGLKKEYENLAQTFIRNFMIEGEETEDLQEVLSRAHDSLIDLIWDEIEEEESHIYNRKEKEERLYLDIPRSFLDEFVYIDEYHFKLLIKIATGDSMEPMEIANAESYFSKRGWLFSFVKDNKSTFVMTKPIQDIWEENVNDEETEILLNLVMGLRRALRAALHLFGVVKREHVFRLFMSYMLEKTGKEDTIAQEELYELLNQIIEDLSIRDEGFWIDRDYVILNDLQDEYDYEEILENIKVAEYYEPDDDAIELYSNSIIDLENQYYKKALSLLEEAVEDKDYANDLMYNIIFWVIEEDMNSSSVLEFLIDRDVLFETWSQAEMFFQSFNNLVFELRRWSNRGYSDKELGILKIEWIPDLSPIVSQKETRIVKNKIGRNDLCPCGSGKKYKKCCLVKS